MNKNHKIITTCSKILALIGLIGHAIVILLAWELIPNIIPTHYDLSGNVNAYGDKTDLLILLTLNFAIFFVLGWFANNPQKFNYPWEINESNKEYQYWMGSLFVHIIRLELMWLFKLISLNIIYFSINGINLFSMSWFIPLVVILSSFTVIGWLLCGSRH